MLNWQKSKNMDSMSSYHDYPSRHSLLDDTTEKYASSRKIDSSRDSNSKAVISALLGLQQKIRRLETERSEAENNLKALAGETAQYHDVIKRREPTGVKQTMQAPSSKHAQELQSQLAYAESRSQLLEKQLEYMRNMVHGAEHERSTILRQKELETMQQTEMASEQVRAQKAKLSELEKEHAQLKMTQSLTEGKIKELEDKVKEEKHQREILQSQAVQLRTTTEPQKKMPEAGLQVKVKKTKKKKPQVAGKKVIPSHKPTQSKPPCALRHLRLKMENVPFVAGKATTPSHNVNANMQNLIALMKTHNPAWCGSASDSKRTKEQRTKKARSHSLSSVTTSDSDLADLLLGLQDEFGHLAFEQQEITKQMQETTNRRLHEDLEQELAHISSKMEAKGEQINKLKKHKQKLQVTKKRASHAKQTTTKFNGKSSTDEVKVVTTVTATGKGIQSLRVQTPDSKSNHRMLHNMKALQTSLRKDDLSWD